MANEYGGLVKDTSGNTIKLTPDIANVVSSGTESMPSGLVDTNKYYVSVDLPGTSAINGTDVGTIFNAFLIRLVVDAVYIEHPVSNLFMIHYYASDDVTNYTKNLATGVMSTWTPGNHSDLTNESLCDAVLSFFPMAYWEQMGASTFTDVKIFAATMYHVYDGSATAFIDAYTIYTSGVEDIDYVITMRRKTVE